MKAIDALRKSADSATTRVDSYKGFDDQGHDMGARAVMEQGQPETPRPHKTTQGDVSDGETDRFSKGADNRVTAPEIVQPVPVTPSQSVLKAKKIAPASLPTPTKTDGNRMRFGKPYRSMVKTFADKRSAMEKTALMGTSMPGTKSQWPIPMTPPGSPTLLPPGSTSAGSPNQPTPGAGPQPVPMPPPPGSGEGPPPVSMPPPPGAGAGPPPVSMPPPPPSTAGVPLPTLEQQGDPLMNQGTIPGTHPSLESPAAGPQGDSLMPKTEPGRPWTTSKHPAQSWGGAWDALKGAWGKLPTMGKGILGGGGIAMLLLLLMKLFGKRGDASYSEGEIERAGNLLDRMSRRQKMALWGEAQAQPDEIEKIACNMAKRYSRTHKVGKPPAKKGQFAMGNRFQGTKTAAGFGSQWAQRARSLGNKMGQRPAAPSVATGAQAASPPTPRQPTGMFGPSSALPVMPWWGGTPEGDRMGQRPATPPPRPKITRTTTSGPGPVQRMTDPPPPRKPVERIVPPTIPPSKPLNLQLPRMSPSSAPQELGRISEQLGQIKVPAPTKPPVLGKAGTWATKQAQDPLTGLGGMLGYRQAPKERKAEGAIRGGLRGFGTGVGAGLGALGGGALGSATASGRGPTHQLVQTILAALAGAGLGGAGGYGLSGALLGKPSWEQGGGPNAGQQSREDMVAELQAKSAEEKAGYWRGGVHYSHKTHKPDRPKKKKKAKKSAANFGAKTAADMPAFTSQDRPAKVKEIYGALKRDHPEMPAGMKARIASRQGKPGRQSQGPPYKGPLTKTSWAADLAAQVS